MLSQLYKTHFHCLGLLDIPGYLQCHYAQEILNSHLLINHIFFYICKCNYEQQNLKNEPLSVASASNCMGGGGLNNEDRVDFPFFY